MKTITQELLALSQQYFQGFLKEFAAYGLEADPSLELRPGTGMLCYYDLKDSKIYLSIPDLDAPEGKLHLLFLRSLLACPNNKELFELFKILLPQAIAHEMAHHFRHRLGLFGDNLWHEEQVANQLAIAVTENRLSPVRRERARFLLKRAIDSLARTLKITELAIDSFHSIWQALNAAGKIGDATLESMEIAWELFAIEPAELLESSHQLSAEIGDRLERRDEIIKEINQHYAADYLHYLYYQLSWLYLDLTTPDFEYVEAVARQHFGLQIPLLPLLPEEGEPSQRAILACYKAYQDTLPLSETASRYFYKRYRSLLIAKLRWMRLEVPEQLNRLRQGESFLLQNWEGCGRDPDLLSYLSHLALPSLRPLFPSEIAQHPDLADIGRGDSLPAETDRRLWRYIALEADDRAAENTLARLSILDRIEIYGALPATAMLELSRNLFGIKLAPGETIIWQGDRNQDAYISIEGKLEIFVSQEGEEKHLAAIAPGELFGEMAFLTGEPRSASVRALEASECLVLKKLDMQLCAFKYPTILMQIGRILAERLNNTNQNVWSNLSAAGTAESPRASVSYSKFAMPPRRRYLDRRRGGVTKNAGSTHIVVGGSTKCPIFKP